ncbi:MAG: exonuclease domain-containing protein [Eubacterium sp.]|nr:exonuclease domain-containing protein [Eubacterium sp.]
MKYIVMDLEWNQSAYGRSGEHPRLPFEIIEIGAVKLNHKYQLESEFRELITPRVYRKLHHTIRKMLSYDEKELQEDGSPFPEVCKRFLEWCGKDAVFCTWGMSDLFYLQNNMDFYHMDMLPYPVHYYNIQQIYADKYDPRHMICKLEKAVEALGLPEDEPFHAAISDARYTAKVLAAAKLGNIKKKYTIDLYQRPKSPEDIINDRHDEVIDYISVEYPSRQLAMADDGVVELRCPKCGRLTIPMVDWFMNAQNTEMAVGRCTRHGFAEGRIRFRNTPGSEEAVYAVKRITRTTQEGYESLMSRQSEIREKKKQKRHESERRRSETRRAHARKSQRSRSQHKKTAQ